MNCIFTRDTKLAQWLLSNPIFGTGQDMLIVHVGTLQVGRWSIVPDWV